MALPDKLFERAFKTRGQEKSKHEKKRKDRLDHAALFFTAIRASTDCQREKAYAEKDLGFELKSECVCVLSRF